MSGFRPHGLRSPVDLDPADFTARIELRTRLIAVRKARGLSCWALAPILGWQNANMCRRESDPAPNFELPTIAAWANGLDHHFHLIPVVPHYTDTSYARELEAMGRDDFQHAAAAERLIASRKAAGLSQRQLAERMGLGGPTVNRLEERGPVGMTASWQKYARGLGGRLDLVLSPFESGEVTV